MNKLVNKLKGYNIVVRLVENKLYMMVEHKQGEFVFLNINQTQMKQVIKDLNLEVLN